MTSWTDLIDTDPVGAYHAREEWINRGIPTTRLEDGRRVMHEEMSLYGLGKADKRLMSNLAALAEQMAETIRAEYAYDNIKEVIQEEMSYCKNPDGSRRFPEVT